VSRILGIDLGAYSVKVAVMNPGFRSATMVDLFERLVPAGDEPHEVRAARVLGEIVREQRLDQDIAYAALAGDRVFVRVLEFGFKNLRRPELAKAIGAELEGILPIELEEMVYTFETLPKEVGQSAPVDDPAFVPPSPGPLAAGPVAAPTDGMRVLACAGVGGKIRGFLDLIQGAGVEPRGLLAAPAAYPRLLERVVAAQLPGAPAGKLPLQPPTAVIDVGHERTDVCVVVAGHAVFLRTIARGGRHLTDAIAKIWRLPWAQAESAKHQDGFVASTAEPAPSEAWARIHEALIPELGPLARDLRQTLLACRAKTGATVERCLLVGGGARLRGLTSYLGEQLQLPVAALGPAEDHGILGPRLAGLGARADVGSLAAGIAMEGASGRPSFDLRQGDLAFKADLSFLRAKAVPLAAAVLLIIAFAAVSAYANLFRLRKAERALDKRLAAESAEVMGRAMTGREVLDQTSASGVTTDNPMPKMTAWDLLLAFNAALPPKEEVKIDIEDIDIKQGKITVKAVSAPTPTQNALAGIKTLEGSLKKSKCFADFPSPQSQPGREDNREFSLTIKTPCM